LFRDNAGFTIRRGEGATKLQGRLRAPNNDGYEDKKIIGLFDFDKEGRECIHHLKKDTFWQDDHSCFYAMLLPIPEELNSLADLEWEHFASFVEVENLLPSDFLIEKSLVTNKNSPAGTYQKIKANKKPRLWEQLFDLPSDAFRGFSPLFTKISELFELEK